MKTPKPIPRAVFDSIWAKWQDGRGQSKGAMMKWWLEIGQEYYDICKHTGGTGKELVGKYCSLMNGKCVRDCTKEFHNVQGAVYANDHPAFTSACDAMLVAIARIPVIEDEDRCIVVNASKLIWEDEQKAKPFVEGQPVWWKEREIAILKAKNPFNWHLVSQSDSWCGTEENFRHLTKPELAEWNEGQGARDLMEASEATRKAVKNYEDVLAKKSEPKAPTYYEGDVVMVNGIIIATLTESTDYGWRALTFNGSDLAVSISSLRPLTEDEWINTIGKGKDKVEFKARVDRLGNVTIFQAKESILSVAHKTSLHTNLVEEFTDTFNKAIIKALDIKVMPRAQWERLNEEKEKAAEWKKETEGGWKKEYRDALLEEKERVENEWRKKAKDKEEK